jgi:radical SAM superfamily enzyme YgiQ (UPF0313 family)
MHCNSRKADMKITLILAASLTDPLRKREPFMPLTLPLLAATAPDHHYHLVDLMWEDDVDFNRPADLVGISVRLTSENRAYAMADEFRRRGVKVVLGGPQVSAVPHRAKEHADAVAVGEGEPLWPVIVRDAGENRLRDFYVCSPEAFDGRGLPVFQLKSHADLSTVPHPLVHLWKRKYVFDSVFAVRGCHVDCDFCSVTRFFGKKYRKRPVADVLDEIRGFKGKYYLLDDTVFGRETTYDYYLELYDAVARLDRKRHWTGQANLDAAASPRGRKVIEAAARAGLFYAAVGIESISPAVLKSCGAISKMGIRSGEDALERIRENIRFIQDQGIIVSGWFVIGYEDDTVDTYYRTLDFCREMHLLPAIFPVKVLPGTRLHERLKRENKLDDGRLFNFVHPSMRDDDIYRALAAVRSEGFSLGQNLRRARFYAPRFKTDRIEKTIFLLILQSKLAKGLDISRDEFYVDRLGN